MGSPEHAVQRQALIPKIAKTLASLKDHKACKLAIDDRPLKIDDWPCGSREWIEEKLWLSMTRALGAGELRFTRIPSTDSELWKESLADDCMNARTTARTRQDLPLGHSDGQVCGEILRRSYTTLPYHTDAEVAAVSHARQQAANPLGHPHLSSSCAGVSQFDIVHTAAIPGRADQEEAKDSQIDTLQRMTGQSKLTHDVRSTFSHGQHHFPDILRDIGIYDDSQHLDLSLIPEPAIELLNSDEDNSYYNQDLTSTPLSISFGENINTMTYQNSTQSLSELLGDDSHLSSMWMRRRSVCPPGEDDAAQLYNMFHNDPDMKLFSPTRQEDMSYKDAMLFDSYDFSRQSTRSSGSTSPSSYSNSGFEQLERSSLYSYPSQASSRSSSMLPSTSDSKEHKRRSSGMKKSTRPARMSEDDIIFQQTSMSRNVDIKTRKSHRDYSSR